VQWTSSAGAVDQGAEGHWFDVGSNNGMHVEESALKEIMKLEKRG
jgi:hypothetical protein